MQLRLKKYITVSAYPRQGVAVLFQSELMKTQPTDACVQDYTAEKTGLITNKVIACIVPLIFSIFTH